MGRRTISARRGSTVLASLVLAVAAIVGIALTSSYTDAAGPEAAPSPQATPYLPSIADLMIATIQPRHRRLLQAAQDKDWAFAAYEAKNLRGAFDRIGRAHPTDHDVSFSDMLTSVMEQPFSELDSAIRSKDGAGFAKAYADLTAGCNSCHQAMNHGAVAIRVPSGVSASDQDFSPAPP
jgi:hypothetical protein